jgi:hypothetical protein
MANQLGPFPVEFGTVFPSVLSGSSGCCGLWQAAGLAHGAQRFFSEWCARC